LAALISQVKSNKTLVYRRDENTPSLVALRYLIWEGFIVELAVVAYISGLRVALLLGTDKPMVGTGCEGQSASMTSMLV